jgi:hypothetical protein
MELKSQICLMTVYTLTKKMVTLFGSMPSNKSLLKVCIAFRTLDGDKAIPLTYQEIRCHMVWDVKMEDFCRKARFVAVGHMTETPALNTHASVV